MPDLIIKPIFFISAAFSFVFFTSPTKADTDTYITPLKAIEHNGSITITDGSSFYKFLKDGTFYSGPMGISGRVITGKWRISNDGSGALVVDGKWEWMNGMNNGDDFRTMVFAIYPGCFKKISLQNPNRLQEKKNEIFECYFIIQEIIRTPKKKPHPSR